MTIVTPGIVPASALDLARPAWLDAFARFAAGLRFEDLPGDAVARAKLVLLDSLGAIAAGMAEPEMAALVGRLAGEGDAAVIGAGRRAPATVAAFLNGTAGTMLELDEGNQYARGHPGIHVVPALLAQAVRGKVDGRRALLALCLGYEIGARIGIASKLRVTLHPHGTWGTVGAALAVAALQGAPAETLAQTINVASSLGLGTSRRTMLEGGTVRNAYAGVSNQLGLIAADLALSGFSGEADGVGTVYGSILATDFQPEAMTEGLGERWEIARNYFKRHAACRYTHAALDALSDIVAQAGGPVTPDDVAAFEVDTYVWAAQLDHPRPGNMLAAKFSLPFALATSLAHGGATIEAFRDAARGDPTIQALAARVMVREDPDLTARLPGLRPARVRLTLRDGRTFAAEALTNRGDTEDPYPPEEIARKFHEIADPVWGSQRGQAIRAMVGGLESLDDLSALDALLAEPLR
ncbi:MAG TPA: MmgE/PrpD family protein [Beijerinckiaceae bacterium]|jgi:2-methylcitrate dehydratase PrpD